MKALVGRAARRYLAEWAGLFVVLLLGVVLLPRFGVTSRKAWSLGYGVGIAGIGALPVYGIVAKGLVTDPGSFMNRWFASMSYKLVAFAVLVGVVLWLNVLERREFLLALGAAFPVFSLHQVVRLVLLSDQAEALGAAGGAPAEVDVRRR